MHKLIDFLMKLMGRKKPPQPPPPPTGEPLVDDNGILSFIDDNGIFAFIDDLGNYTSGP